MMYGRRDATDGGLWVRDCWDLGEGVSCDGAKTAVGHAEHLKRAVAVGNGHPAQST